MADAKNVGAIAVEILARTDKLQAGLDQAKGKIGAFSGAIAGVAAGVTTFALGLAQNAVGALSGFVMGSFEAIGNAQDLAFSLGTTSQALRELQYAAKQSGADAGTLDSAMRKLMNNIGQGLAGNEAAAESFDRLGLRIEDLAAMDTADVFKKVADQIAKIQTPAQQAQAAVDIFGKSAGSLIPLLAGGSEEIGNQVARFNELQGTMSELDASQVQLAGDLMDDLGYFVEGVANQIAINLAPFIIYASKKFIEFATDGQGAGKMVVQAFDYIVDVVGKVADGINFVKATWNLLVFGVNKGWQLWAQGLGVIAQGIDLLIEKFYDFADTAEGIARGLSPTLGKVWDFMPDRPTTKIADFFNNFAAESGKAADEAFQNMENAWVKFSSGSGSKGVREWADNVKKEASEAAKEIQDAAVKRRELARAAAGTIEREEKEKKEKVVKQQTFRQIDLSVINPNALGIGANVEQQQLSEQKKTNKFLQVIAGNQVGAVYS